MPRIAGEKPEPWQVPVVLMTPTAAPASVPSLTTKLNLACFGNRVRFNQKKNSDNNCQLILPGDCCPIYTHQHSLHVRSYLFSGRRAPELVDVNFDHHARQLVRGQSIRGKVLNHETKVAATLRIRLRWMGRAICQIMRHETRGRRLI